MSERSRMDLPPVVSVEEWQAAREALLAKEKDATRARDALAAERRRLPRVRIEKKYVFDGPGGKVGLSVFLHDGDDVSRTYFTATRGVEALGSVWTFLDLTPLGRQEEWEDSPAGYPQTKPYQWWRRHDEYEDI